MGEPWTTLLTAGAPSILVAYITYRGLLKRETLSARIAEAGRVDSATRAFLDLTMADNARLRKENADAISAVSHLLAVARRWCDRCHDMKHGRHGDRAVANLTLEAAGKAPIEWAPLPALPGFDDAP